MTNVPLLCNICPKSPEFSDISHLLTHVASKGHVTHRENTRIRALQDASVRERLETYDRWYEFHQIARLLSDRMIAKEIKDSTGKARREKPTPHSTTSIKDSKPSKRRVKGDPKVLRKPSPVKIEGVIDPQLSHTDQLTGPRGGRHRSLTQQPLAEDNHGQAQISPTLAVTPHQESTSPFLSQQQCYSHRTYVPRMSDWQGDRSPQQDISLCTPSHSNDNLPQAETHNTDGESDYFQTFLRSPTRTTYPDPSEVTGLPSGFSISSSPPDRETMRVKRDGLDSKDDQRTEAYSASQSPVFRGVRWPGMSIFDSASLDAQRLRNQRKDDTVVEYMEHNSAMVEQLERIYWPDGNLKTQRLITGNVESSPPREPTPPPKPTKRRRTKIDKPVLADLSTNAPKPNRKPRSRKPTGGSPVNQAAKLQTISHKALAALHPAQYVYPRNAHIGYDPPEEDEFEGQLTRGQPKEGRKRAFDIFDDSQASFVDKRPEASKTTKDRISSHTTHGHQRPLVTASHRSDRRAPLSSISPRPNSRAESSSQAPIWAPKPRTLCTKSNLATMNENAENIQPILDDGRRIGDEGTYAINERITQRYFSVTDNQPPQFFSSMPPGMDFGGLIEPKYYGTTLNPLNTYLRQPQLLSSSAQLAVSPHNSQAGLVNTAYQTEHQNRRKLERRPEEREQYR